MTSTRPARRAGFSLIELLAVIGILALLAAITAAALFRAGAAQKAKNTEATLNKIASLLEKRRAAIVDAINRKKDNPPATVLTYANNDADLARTIWIYLRLKQEFPTSYAEATYGISLPSAGVNLPGRTVFATLPYYIPSPPPPPGSPQQVGIGTPEEQAAGCLYLALAQTGSGGVSLESDGLQNQIGDITVVTPSSVVPQKTGQMRVFKDAWGRPISFVRMAYSPELDAPPYANTRSVSKDPIDPQGRLLNVTATGPWNTARLNEFWDCVTKDQITSAPPLATYPTSLATTRNWVMTAVSGGPDGIDNPSGSFGTFFGTDDPATDNLVSFRLRAGMRGD